MGALHAMRIGMAWLLAALPASATTWIVDDNGGPAVDFVNIQAAVDAAVDGDVIEVRDGAYAPFTIDGKSLVVFGVQGAQVRIPSRVHVRNVPPDGGIEFQGLQIGAPFATFGIGYYSYDSVSLAHNTGSVRLLNCVINGAPATGPGTSYPRICDPGPANLALDVSNSDEVVLMACTLRGGNGSFQDAYYCTTVVQAQAAMRLAASHVEMLDCDLVGGIGAYYGHPGGSAARVFSSTLFSHRSTFTGGQGDGGTPPFPPGPDWAGLQVDAASIVTWKDSTFSSIVGTGAVSEVAMAPYCLGTYQECPCGNNGAGTAGCEHSFGLGGARLEGVGNASVAADTVTLQLTGLNQNGAPTALFFQGTTGSEGTPFNDGLLCASGTVIRMKGKPASNGMVSFGFGQPGDPLVSSAGNVPPAGATRFYQVWYRNNAASFCTPLRFNMSNGVEIEWGP